MATKQIDTECGECGGTGLYSGMCEGDGNAVVCIRCDGSGCAVLRYKEFTGRHGRRGIDFVSLSSGSSLITGCGAKPNTRITYKEFQKDPRFIKRT